MMNTPVLLITFNRPDHTRRVLERILEAKPQELYVFQDGAREGNANDVAKCAEVRQVIDTLWDNYLSHAVAENEKQQPRLHRYYSDINLGCGPGPVTAISWFFEHVEMGIVMEDDCLPTSTIFAFYERLLEIYKDDKRISLITGTNALSKWCSWKSAYLFSKTGGMTMGCWASWRRAWNMFDWRIESWHNPINKEKLRLFIDDSLYKQWVPLLDDIVANPPCDAWDYQWAYARFLHHTYSIVSTVNQMSNIGFGVESTHTPNENDCRANMQLFECQLPLKKQQLKIAKLYDWVMFQRFERHNKKGFLLRLWLKIIDFVCRR